MSTLRQPVKFLDTLMNKVNKTEFYMVLYEDLHNLWVIDIDGKQPPKEMPKRMVNLAYIKVDPKVVKVLYGEENEKNNEPGMAESIANGTNASSDSISSDSQSSGPAGDV